MIARPYRVVLFGWPVAHSLSPRMHRAAFAAAGLGEEWQYDPIPASPEDIESVFTRELARGLRGFNVTVPHKERFLEFVDDLEGVAREVGAVNTGVVDVDGRVVGHNTDVAGIRLPLDRGGIDLRGTSVVVLGAGGAARAAVVAGIHGGCARIVVAARRREAAARLLADVRHRFGRDRFGRDRVEPDRVRAGRGQVDAVTLEPRPIDSGLDAALDQADGLIQATPLGLEDPRIDALGGRSLPRTFVFDLVYAERPTALTERARAAGLLALDGREMLWAQGAAGFELWTGRAAPVAGMRAALGL